MTFVAPDQAHARRVQIFIVLTAIVAVGLTGTLIHVDLAHGQGNVDWLAFGLFTLLLFLGETRESLWMRVGEGGEVTPGWTFAYALMLLGSPIGAVAAMAFVNIFIAVRRRLPLQKAAFNTLQIALSMSAGALVLHAFGIHGAITDLDNIPISWGIGILAGGCAVFVLNGILIAIVIGLHSGTGFIATLRSGLALSMTADGALLSLAPVFVIAIDYSVVLVPLLCSTSYMVIKSARNALHRAHEANHDPLTGLLNRRAFDDRLSRTFGLLGSERDAVVLVMDFDGFKDINDALGHQVGDMLLEAFARRLVDELPPTAAAARLGGDEFAVMIPGKMAPSLISASIAQLHERLTDPFDLDGFPLSVRTSVGVATAPHDGADAESILAAADLAMYRAKQFETGVEHHHSEETALGSGRIGILSELADTIATGQLEVHYQPQLNIETGVVDAVEALVRWQHPMRGTIQPNDFIGLAEQTDLIDPLTEFVLMRSIRDLQAAKLDYLGLSINVAPRSLNSRVFATMVLNCLDETGYPAAQLELEITERAIANDVERIGLTIDRVRDAGVRVALDDFGTGYSSFATLRGLKADRLKVDKQFTKQICESPEDELVVRKIVELAHGLGLQVVAEGVETRDIWRVVEGLMCDHAQGYAIARPMPVTALARWLRDQHAMTLLEVLT